MTVDGERGGVGGHCAEIVEQQAYAYTAVGRAEQMLKQDFARHVLVPDEILHVEAALRRIRQGQPCGQASRPSRSVWRPDSPGCAATRGRTIAASAMPPLFFMAVEDGRSPGLGKAAAHAE